MKIILVVLAFCGFAQASDYYLCKEVSDPEWGFLLRTTDKPVGARRYTAMVKVFSLCGFHSDQELGCRRGDPGEAFEKAFLCDNQTISLYRNLDGIVSVKRRHGPGNRTESIRCEKLSFEKFKQEREQLSHCGR